MEEPRVIYMVLFVDIESGDVIEVFESGEVGVLGESAKEVKPPFDIKDFTSDKAIGTFYTRSSPG